ncbi:MAG: gamma-glutamyl-gamma-aminobutyrate hydrolase family protein [Clostridiales bacterium]|nr:gamma-glutamyl-gamma-aminobutyrate hydrolase family protein [Clostridiales bacterium]
MVSVAIPQMGHDLFRKYMKSKYTKSLKAAGARAVWVELDNVDAAIKETLKCDGLLLPGGADINPALYSQKPSALSGKPNDVRDNAEPKILRAFLQSEKPILCICRGVQMLNVYCGGSLVQDIKAVQKSNHSDILHKNRGNHYVELRAGTKLAQIFTGRKIKVNSLHHQVIDAVGENLIVNAVSDDGYVEGVEMQNHSFCIGVQWHPEHMAGQVKEQQKLFFAFIKACEDYNGQRTA